ncbi:bifunctional 2',3'-cyclic-nucleotide 2'-phosphodiesterase/3'-nucleotidase [Shimia aestuarii]|uniref:bifunctional 2',3'-cyclic-nucleotide 2'-phosphodiesterase/3'-nucleotidase n=1 Tax=Shimia aestuarii TaxID=254406 RepID=UPI001FB39991
MRPTSPPAPDAPHIPLTLFATSDVHGHLLSYDYAADQPAEAPSLARIATLLTRERATTRNSLLFDNGDFLQGTALADLFADHPVSDERRHPAIDAMNALGVDAAALGNHEFNLDLETLASVLATAQFPLLSANLHPTESAPDALRGLWQPSILLPRDLTDTDGVTHRLTIGVFGVLPPQVVLWDHSRIGDALTSEDMIDAATRAIADLRAQGADLVIGLCHTGIDTAPARPGMENAGLHIAALPGLDAMVLGHTHLRFPAPDAPNHPAIDATRGTLHGVPAVLPNAAGGALGRIDLRLAQSDTGWQVVDAQSRALPTRDTPEDPALLARLAPAHDETLTAIRRPIGTLAQPLHSFFAPLPGCDALRLVAEAQAAYLATVFQDSPLADLPLISAVAPQKAGGRGGPGHFTNVAAGPVAMSHVTDLQYFPNDLAVLRLTGAEIADWLEMAAGFFHQITPGDGDQPLTDPAIPAYNFDTLYGLTYEIDLTAPARLAADGSLAAPESRRIRALCLNEAPLAPDADLLLAVNTYRAGGGGYFPNATPAKTVYEDTTKIRDIVARHISETGGAPGLWPDPWRFTPISGAAGVFDTAPTAATYFDAIPGLTALGPTETGFLRLRYDFPA